MISGYSNGYIASSPPILDISKPTMEAKEPNPLLIIDDDEDSGATTASEVYSFNMLKAMTTPTTIKHRVMPKISFHFLNNLLSSCSKSASFNSCFFSNNSSVLFIKMLSAKNVRQCDDYSSQ